MSDQLKKEMAEQFKQLQVHNISTTVQRSRPQSPRSVTFNDEFSNRDYENVHMPYIIKDNKDPLMLSQWKVHSTLV